ncbi:DUF1343 domain-containing protein [candidate division WOR-3 bacterium]|nr:DUF1343 domain-containing protein [candidate division WOR-3 bacterium]MCK4576839.1 DUF1343 domain-containing protein [candidate division WOR-3 bacterium]
MTVNVKTGIDVLEREGFDRFKNQRVGLIINPSSVNRYLESTLKRFKKNNIKITALFGPEHGIRGESQDQEECKGFMDEQSGAPIYSLYGKYLAPLKWMLKNVDTLVFDIQDVGARYYTFIWTMSLAMEKAAQFKKRFIVLDRPNPIGGLEVEGPVLDKEYISFVGLYPIPVRYSMTIGELALMLKNEFNIGVELDVIKMDGWQRAFWFDETGLPWISPSTNMPTLDTATVYTGMCLLEGTNISEGRGTTKPFEYFGAPWIDCDLVLDELSELSGYRLRPICFKPTWSKYVGEPCVGFQLHITDRRRFKPVRTGLEIIRAVRKTHQEDFKWRKPPYEFEEEKLPFDILIGNSRIREMIEKDYSIEEIEKTCGEGIEDFLNIREKYLLYK